MALNRSRRKIKPTRKFAYMVDMGLFYGSDEEPAPPCYDSAEEGEPVPPSFYEKPSKRRILESTIQFSGEVNGIPFQYTRGERNLHIDTRGGDVSTFGRDEVDLFIHDVYYLGDMVFRVRPLNKSVFYRADGRDYKMTLNATPQSLHVKGRSELGFGVSFTGKSSTCGKLETLQSKVVKTLIQNSLYGTFQMRGDVMHLEFFRDAAKTTPFFTFSVRHLTE